MERLNLQRAACAAVLLTLSLVIAPSASASGRAQVLYAYPAGTSSASRCPKTSKRSRRCDLAHALSLVRPGGTVALAVSGNERRRSTFYIGNFSVTTTGTSPTEPVKIGPASGVHRPILDGNSGSATGCPTTACNGPILTLADGLHVKVDGITIQHGDNPTGDGGGIQSGDGFGHTGFLTVTRTNFSHDEAQQGGAIASGDFGTGTLIVRGSKFVNDRSSALAAAIDSGTFGSADLLVVGSKFVADAGAVGAISSGTLGQGAAEIRRSAFLNNSGNVGAIASGVLGVGHLSIDTSRFERNTASGNGGAVASELLGSGTLVVSRSTFWKNSAAGNGGAIDDDEIGVTTSTDSISRSTFVGNSAADGGAIDVADLAGVYSIDVVASTFARNRATTQGADVSAGGASSLGVLGIAGDVFGSPTCSISPTLVDGGYNVAASSSCLNGGPHDVRSARAAALAAPAFNGGPTPTSLLLPRNPAVHLIPPRKRVSLASTTARLCPTVDQRGVRSAPDKRCDAGAVQSVLRKKNASGAGGVRI